MQKAVEDATWDAAWDALSKMLTVGNHQVSSTNKMQGKGGGGGIEGGGTCRLKEM